MRNGIRTLCQIAAVGLLAIAAMAIADDAIADDYPNGCVDCHKLAKPGGDSKFDGDFRLGPLLAQIGHRWLKKVQTVPDDCKRCHGADEDLPLSTMIHLVHYEKPEANVYTTEFGGKCSNCHAMDGPTGEPLVKNGPRNW
jgi:hypothetical protein